MDIFKIIGIVGLILICIGMIVKDRRIRDIFSFFGGVGLLIYSISLKDLIFIILEALYVIVVSFDFIKQNKKS